MRNFNEIKILKSLYASCMSELTAVLTYSYQTIVTEKEVADVLREISLDEMDHLDILGNIIYSLGAKPTYYSNAQVPWSAKCVDYSTELKKILKNDLRFEKKAIEAYECAIEKIDDQQIKDQLTQILNDEKRHAEMLESLIVKFGF